MTGTTKYPGTMKDPPRHASIKFQNVSDQKNIQRASREGRNKTKQIRAQRIRIKVAFLNRIIELKRKWSDTFKILSAKGFLIQSGPVYHLSSKPTHHRRET